MFTLTRAPRLLLAASLAMAVLEASASAQSHGNPNPNVVPYSQEYANLSVRWWQWALSQPVTPHNARTTNPLVDTTGVAAHNGQPTDCDVFFLAGLISFNSGLVAQAERTITISGGKHLFFPLLNFEQDNLGVTPPLTVKKLREAAAFGTTQVASLFTTIDGVSLRDLASYRSISPVFHYTLPPNHPALGTENLAYFVTGGQANFKGIVNPAVGDGYYLLLKPLSPGHHTVHFGGTSMTQDGDGNPALFQLDITYHIHVIP